MSIFHIRATISANIEKVRSRGLFFVNEKWKNTTAVDVFIELEELGSGNIVMRRDLFKGSANLEESAHNSKGYRISQLETDVIYKKILGILSQLDNQGWEVLPIVEKQIKYPLDSSSLFLLVCSSSDIGPDTNIEGPIKRLFIDNAIRKRI